MDMNDKQVTQMDRDCNGFLFLKMLLFMITKKTIYTLRCRYYEIITILLSPYRDFSAAFQAGKEEGEIRKHAVNGS